MQGMTGRSNEFHVGGTDKTAERRFLHRVLKAE